MPKGQGEVFFCPRLFGTYLRAATFLVLVLAVENAPAVFLGVTALTGTIALALAT